MAVETEHPPTNEQEESRKSRVVPRWVVIGALVIFAGVVIVLVYGYLARPGWIGVANKTFWDYLELLFVPAALALGVYWLNRRQDERDHQAAEELSRRESEAQAAQRERELEVENERAQDAALQAYLDQMSQLLTDKERPLRRAQPSDNLSVVARARTLTVLPRLSSERKGSVVRFLYESGLIIRDRPILDLQQADLREVDLSYADLRAADLHGAILSRATLFGAILQRADLSRGALDRANLRMTDLKGANLNGAALNNANLIEAELEGAKLYEAELYEAKLYGATLLGADLRGASLYKADLPGAYLSGADLRRANLTEANLYRAQGVTNEELEQQVSAAIQDVLVGSFPSLSGATMPNGQKYEDWLKSKGSGEDGENSGPS